MASDWGSETDISYPPLEERLHNPNAEVPSECPTCQMDAGTQRDMNRSCCTAPINAYHDARCPHAVWDQSLAFPEHAPRSAMELWDDKRGRVLADERTMEPPETWAEFWERVLDPLCPECGCASSVARGCRNAFHQRPGKYSMAVAARRAGKSIAYYASEQIKIYDNATLFNAQPWTADVDATFENEFTMNSEGP